MHLHNRFLPPRPLTTKDGNPLNFSTHISHPQSTYNIYDPATMKAQVKLYHWSRSMDWLNQVPIGELHAFLFYNIPEVTTRQMGRTIVQATPYNSRKLKGVTKDNPHATMTYVWGHREELQYGLEWMLSMWIWRFENKWIDIHQNTPEQHHEMMLEIFDEIGALSNADLKGLYLDPIVDLLSDEDTPSEIDWYSLWAKYDMSEEKINSGPIEKRHKLRSLP